MRALRLAICAALIVVFAVPNPAAARDNARCGRCQHQFVLRRPLRSSDDPRCRVCRVYLARINVERFQRRYREAETPEARRKIEKEWDTRRTILRADGYEMGRIVDALPPRLLPPDSRDALTLALHDEAQRLTRRASWSKRMADALRTGRNKWLRANRRDDPERRGALWLYDDLIEAWSERSAMFATLASEYTEQATGSEMLARSLPAPSMPAVPAYARGLLGVGKAAGEIQQALRLLLVVEHRALHKLLATMRSHEPPEPLDESIQRNMRAVREAAMSTALVVNLHPKRVSEMDILRSHLLEDSELARFFERAPVLMKAMQTHLERVRIVGVREVGPLEFVDTIRGRDGGYSAKFGGASVWTFGDSVLDKPGVDGKRWRSSTWCQTKDLDAKDGLAGLTEPLDLHGAPFEFLPFTQEELEFNARHNREQLGKQRKRWALWPGPIVVHPRTGKALVFYGKLKCGLGQWDFKLVGHSLAKWDKPNGAVERPVVDPKGTEPTLLFGADEILFGQGATVVGNFIYAYGVKTQGLSWPCILARANFDRALRKDAWEFFAGPDGWVEDASRAVEIMQAAPQLSVHWNEHLKRYVAFYSTPLRNSISMRTAPRPEGPWSKERLVHDGLPPKGKDQWNYCGIGHAELQKDGGRIEYVSYYRTTGFLKGEIRLVEIRFR